MSDKNHKQKINLQGENHYTLHEGAVKLLEKLVEYAPEELAVARRAADDRQEQERNSKRFRVNKNNHFKDK